MKLFLDGIAVDCIIGDLPDERNRLQRLRVDIELAVSDAVASSDNLADTADYVALAEKVRAALVAAKCRLIERAAKVAAEACLSDARVGSATATVVKAGAVVGMESASAAWTAKRQAGVDACANQGGGVRSVAEKLVALLEASGMTCATAESCTGGGIGSAITAVPGSSAVYLGGVVSYANEVKSGVLGVREDTLARVGAVSSETAAEMAEGARRLTGADIAVSVTGIAGPGGGTPEKPVGLVWFGLASADCVRTEKAIFGGDRRRVREQAVVHALGMLTTAAVR
jgi:dihydroneopterin aldolase